MHVPWPVRAQVLVAAFSAAIERVVGPTTDELDATEEIWAFFERHALPPAPA